MKKRSNVLILACIPAVFILILLGTGLPQRFLPAVTVGDRTYSVAQYNFYYYENYAAYVTEHYDELDELGLDLTRALKSQRYDEDLTWAQLFRVRALEDMRTYAILYDAAMEEGFLAVDRVAEVRAEKEAELWEYCAANNIKRVETYLTGLYDAGMTEEIFYRELEGAMEDWCLDPARRSGDTAILRGAAGWYLVYFSGWGESAEAIEARQTQRDQAYEGWLAARAEDYPVKTHALGMQIAR